VKGGQVNMDCRQFRYNISAYIDGILDDSMISGMEKHIDECPQCRKEYEAILEIKEMCGKLPTVDLPFGFHERFSERLRREGRNNMFNVFRKINKKAMVGLAAALVLVLAGALVMGGLDGRKFDMARFETSPSEAGDSDMAASDIGGYGKTAGMPSRELADIADEAIPESPAEPDADYYDGSDIRGEAQSESHHELEISSNTQALTGEQVEGERKIIRSAYMAIETTEFDRTVDEIIGRVGLYQGYIETSEVQGKPRRQQNQPTNRKAHLEVRIPRKSFDQFISGLGDVGSVINQQITGEDITGQYLDVEARLKSLKLQEERLLTILSKAELLQDIIELERELSNVRYEIEHYTGTLKKWDNLIDYSKVTIDVYEVHEIKEEEPIAITWGDRIINGFRRSCRRLWILFQDLVIFVVSAIPYLALLGIIVLGTWVVIVRPIKRKRENRKIERTEENNK